MVSARVPSHFKRSLLLLLLFVGFILVRNEEYCHVRAVSYPG